MYQYPRRDVAVAFLLAVTLPTALRGSPWLPEGSSNIRAQRVVAEEFVVERGGKVLAELGVYDAGPDAQWPALVLHNGEGQIKARIYLREFEEPEIEFFGKDGASRLQIYGDYKGAAGIALKSLDGYPLAGIAVHPTEGGKVWIKAGEVVWKKP